MSLESRNIQTIQNLLQSSIQFENIRESFDHMFQESNIVNWQTQSNGKIFEESQPLQTFTSYLSQHKQKNTKINKKNNFQQRQRNPPPPILVELNDEQIEDDDIQINQSTLETPNNPQPVFTKHTRGPSKIKDIMQSLETKLMNEFQKITENILDLDIAQQNNEFQEENLSYQTSDQAIIQHGQANLTQSQLLNDLRNHQRLSEQISHYKEEEQELVHHQNESSVDLTQSDLDSQNSFDDNDEQNIKYSDNQEQNKKETRKYRKRNKNRKQNCFLDIIRENSSEHVSPDNFPKSQKQSKQESEITNFVCLKDTGNLSNSDARKKLSNSLLEQKKKMQQNSFSDQSIQHSEQFKVQSQQETQQLFRFVESNRNNFQLQFDSSSESEPQNDKNEKPFLIRQTTSIIDEIGGFLAVSYQQQQQEIDPVLQSWNNLCARIISKNLLPLPINIERITEESELKSKGSILYNFDKAKRKLQIAQRLKNLDQTPTSTRNGSYDFAQQNQLNMKKKSDQIQPEFLIDHSSITPGRNNSGSNQSLIREFDQQNNSVISNETLNNKISGFLKNKSQFNSQQSEISVDQQCEQDQNYQFSPNYSEVCKKINFTACSIGKSQEDGNCTKFLKDQQKKGNEKCLIQQTAFSSNQSLFLSKNKTDNESNIDQFQNQRFNTDYKENLYLRQKNRISSVQKQNNRALSFSQYKKQLEQI